MNLIQRFVREKLPTDWDALLFVGLVWAVQSYLLLTFVMNGAVNVPYYDEWEMVPMLAGKQPITLSWLWSQHNEHRIFLGRLVYLVLETVGRYDFRVCMIVDVLVLSALSIVCCTTVRRWRGCAHYSDAFFPLAILHWGQSENLFWGFQIVFVMGATASMVALVCLVRPALGGRIALLLGICASSMPLVGGHGLAMVPALAVCTFASAASLRKAGSRRVLWLSVAALGALSLALTAFYFVDYVRPAKHPVSPSLAATLRSGMQFLSLSFGTGQSAYWPLGGYLIGGLLGMTVTALLFCLVRRPVERGRAFRLLVFLGGMACLSFGVAWARAGFYPGGMFISRYVTLAVPLICAIYMAWELIGASRLRNFMQMFLCITAAVLVLRNRDDGFALFESQRGLRATFREDVDRRTPIHELDQKYCNTMYYVCGGALGERLRMLRDMRVPGFINLPD